MDLPGGEPWFLSRHTHTKHETVFPSPVPVYCMACPMGAESAFSWAMTNKRGDDDNDEEDEHKFVRFNISKHICLIGLPVSRRLVHRWRFWSTAFVLRATTIRHFDMCVTSTSASLGGRLGRARNLIDESHETDILFLVVVVVVCFLPFFEVHTLK